MGYGRFDVMLCKLCLSVFSFVGLVYLRFLVFLGCDLPAMPFWLFDRVLFLQALI